MKFILLFIGLLFSNSVWAQSTGVSIKPSVDCTPICGNPTCCIARTETIPVCSIEGKPDVSTVQKLISKNKITPIANMCLNERNQPNINAIVQPEKLREIDRWECHWGCCGNARLIVKLRANPELAPRLFARTQLATLGEQIGRTRTVSPDAERKIADAITKQRVCIFCCTF